MVSGTNESFTVTAAITPRTNDSGLPQWTGSYISSLTVELGGVSVYTDDFTDESCTSKTITVKWDMTHFTHNTTKDIKVTAKMKVWRGIKVYPSETWIYWDPVGGPPYEVSAPETSVSVCIYNYGWAGDILQFAYAWNCRQYALMAYSDMNHYAHESMAYVPGSGLVPDVQQWQAEYALERSTIFFIHCHGEVYENTEITTGGWGSLAWVLYPSDVLTRRQWAEQNGYPPLNFAYINSCDNGQANSGGSNDNALAFLYPHGVIYDDGHFTTDRAFLAFKITVNCDWSPVFAETFWQEVSDGATVNTARQLAYDDLYDAFSGTNDFTYGPNDLRVVTGLYGDQQCRLHGLYTGADGYNTIWYEVQL